MQHICNSKHQIYLALFRDGKITWYRIIVLFTYGAALAIDLQSRGQTEMIQQIPNLLASEAFNSEVGFINPWFNKYDIRFFHFN